MARADLDVRRARSATTAALVATIGVLTRAALKPNFQFAQFCEAFPGAVPAILIIVDFNNGGGICVFGSFGAQLGESKGHPDAVSVGFEQILV